MERIFALVQGTTVVNLIIAEDEFVDSIKNEYSYIVEVTNLTPRPGIGAAYNSEDGTFTLFQLPVPEVEPDFIDVEEVTPTPALEA